VNRVPVDDPADPRLVPFTHLTDEKLRRRREAPGGDLAGLFMCEGAAVTRRALETGHRAHSVLVVEDLVRYLPAELPDDVPIYVGPSAVVESVTGYAFHRGFVAAFHRPPLPHHDTVIAPARRLLVCENVTNPTNLGVIVRSCAALGIDGMLLDPTSCDPLYRRVVRVSMGSVFAFPHARLPRLPGGLDPVVDAGFRLVGLTPDPGAERIGVVDPAPPLALVLGAEGPGLSASTSARLDHLVRIPMRQGIDSLNVGAAAAIAAYVLGGQA
jgi:tRNA G18 (ribose-2'-O)-methylase SpoU